jgi:hypothetical protein
MSELQTEEVVQEEVQTEQPEAGTVESGSELATDTGGAQEQKPEDSGISEGAKKAIDLQHKKYRDEERLRIQREKELEETKKRLEEIEASKPQPKIPNMPDALDYDSDADFQAAVRARDEAIRQVAEREAATKLEQTRKQQAEEEAQSGLLSLK